MSINRICKHNLRKTYQIKWSNSSKQVSNGRETRKIETGIPEEFGWDALLYWNFYA